ncbi:hypothetical protein Acr_10g0007550 [Actinidia rufa]|uniref:Uncharacterized protein n=1 Tax=Actinidia rufa TaxID=165716 RepID=A0A7J0F9J6_9ERIC|nr:hypothetical protein Acr_10g0007550 [Actinidia rufa]
MVLNWAQLLVHDDEALYRFRADHYIPDDVMIERPGPNDDANWVEGEGNCIPIRTWFIHQGSLRFPLSQLLKKVMALCYLTFMRSERCAAAAITMVNNCGRTHKVVELLSYIPAYRHTIPHRVDHRGQPRFPPLRIYEWALRQRNSLSIEVSDLIEGTPTDLKRLREEAEGKSSSSGSSSEKEVDMAPKQRALGKEKAAEGEPQRQVPNPVPVVPCPVKVQLDILSSHSFGCLRTSGTPELWSPKFSTIELGRELTSADSSKDHETCLALRKAIMLPQDVTELVEEDSEGFRGRLVMMRAQLFALKNTTIHAHDEAEAAIEEKNKALQEVTELWKVASNEIFKEVFDRGFN